MMIAAPIDRVGIRQLAEHQPAEQHRPDDQRVLIRHHHARVASLSERTTQNSDTTEVTPRPPCTATSCGGRRRPSRTAPRRRRTPGRRRVASLISTVSSVSRSDPRGDHQQRVDDAAGERDQRRQREARGRGPQRDQDAAEADQHRGPAPPADVLARAAAPRAPSRRSEPPDRRSWRRRAACTPTAQKNIAISIDDSTMRRTCRPGRGAFTNAALPARQMNGPSSSSVIDAAEEQELADRILRHQPLADRAVRARTEEHRHQHVSRCRRARPNGRWRKELEGRVMSVPAGRRKLGSASHASQPGRLPRSAHSAYLRRHEIS